MNVISYVYYNIGSLVTHAYFKFNFNTYYDVTNDIKITLIINVILNTNFNIFIKTEISVFL